MDSVVTSHMASDDGTLTLSSPSPYPPFVTIGNGSIIPILHLGRGLLPPPDTSFLLNDVLVVPSLIKNLIYVLKFIRDNSCSIEFDSFGFSVNDLRTKTKALHSNSSGDATQPMTSATSPHVFLSTVAPSNLWHRRLGHPGHDVMMSLQKSSTISCNKVDRYTCHACQLGKHIRLPFSSSTSTFTVPFHFVHCDLWTSPVLSTLGYQYYPVILDYYFYFGLFLYARNPKLGTLLYLFMTMFARNSNCLSSHCKPTTARST